MLCLSTLYTVTSIDHFERGRDWSLARTASSSRWAVDMSFASLPPSHPRYRAPLPSARAEADALHASTDAQPAFVPAERPGGAPKRARFAAPAALPQLSASAAVAAGVDPALLADRRRWFPAEYATWRKDKRAAWDVLPEHPDAFYLKYLPPGEKAREGAWTEEEEATFLRMLGEHRFAYEGKWGLFSMYIRGRTGLQCKAFYEGLAKTQKLGAARRAVRPRASAAHAPAASDGGADALPEPIARMTEQRARRRRDKEAAAAACAAESSPITSDDEMPTEEPLRSASPMPATPPTAEPTTELTDGGGDGDKSMPAPGSVRPLKPAFAPPASTPAQAQTPAAGIAGHQVPSTPLPHITPMPHRPATEQDARASGAPTARAAPRMQHKEPRQVCLPMPMPAFGTASAVDPAAAAAASQAHGALLARIALAAAASRPFAPMRPLAAAPLQEAPAPRVPEPAASEPARAMADEKEKQASASASATAMATLASACELVRPGPSPAPAPTAPGELGCLAPARAVAVDEVHAEPNADSMAGAQTGAAAAMCTVAAALQVVPATEGPAAEEEQQEQPAAEASLPRPHSPVQTLVAESAAPSAAEIDVLARGVGSPAAMPLPALVSCTRQKCPVPPPPQDFSALATAFALALAFATALCAHSTRAWRAKGLSAGSHHQQAHARVGTAGHKKFSVAAGLRAQ